MYMYMYKYMYYILLIIVFCGVLCIYIYMYMCVYLIQSRARQTGSAPQPCAHLASSFLASFSFLASSSASFLASSSALRSHLGMVLLAVFREQSQMTQEGRQHTPAWQWRWASLASINFFSSLSLPRQRRRKSSGKPEVRSWRNSAVLTALLI